MRIIFCGTPRFAVPALEHLIAEKFEIAMVLTNPDEPQGRGYQTRPSPVKLAALEAGIELFQPPKLKDSSVESIIRGARPEAIVVVAYGHIIPPWMIDLPPFGNVNLHASLLPRYRGAAPVPWAIVRGESVTGVTTMRIDRGLDTGPVFLQESTPIRPEDNAETLLERLSRVGAGLMVKTLRGLESENLEPVPQDDRLATLAPLLKKEDGQIDWRSSALEIGRLVRGMRPWPTAFTAFRGRGLKIWKAAPVPQGVDAVGAPGALCAEAKRLMAACGGGSWLEILELQLEGRKRMRAAEFLNGIHLGADEKLGGT